MTVISKEQLIHLYENGGSENVAKTLKISVPTAIMYLKQAGVIMQVGRPKSINIV